MSCGSEIKTLCKEAVLEVTLLIGIPLIIPMLIAMKVTTEATMKLGVLAYNIGIMGVLTIGISIIPIMKLKK